MANSIIRELNSNLGDWTLNIRFSICADEVNRKLDRDALFAGVQTPLNQSRRTGASLNGDQGSRGGGGGGLKGKLTDGG